MSHPVALGWKDLNLLKRYTHGFSNFSFLECILLWMSIQCNVKDYAKVLTKFSCPGPSSSPDSKGLTAVQEVEQLREKVYASLEEYCKTQYPTSPAASLSCYCACPLCAPSALSASNTCSSSSSSAINPSTLSSWRC